MEFTQYPHFPFSHQLHTLVDIPEQDEQFVTLRRESHSDLAWYFAIVFGISLVLTHVDIDLLVETDNYEVAIIAEGGDVVFLLRSTGRVR